MIGGSIILILIVIGALIWLLFFVLPLSPRAKNIAAVILAIGILIWILSLMGIVAI